MKELIDIAYPIRTSATPEQDQLLKYSLRSLEKHGGNFGKVWMIGRRRPWFSSMVKMCNLDGNSEQRGKINSVITKLSTFCAMDKKFVLMSDDFILLKNVSITWAHYKALPSINNVVKQTTDILHKKMLKKSLQDNGDGLKDAPAFITHTPMLIDRPKLMAKICRGTSFRQDYALRRGLHKHPLTEIIEYDVQVRDKHSIEKWPSAFAGQDQVSISEWAMDKNLFDVLDVMFPNKSKYER